MSARAWGSGAGSCGVTISPQVPLRQAEIQDNCETLEPAMPVPADKDTFTTANQHALATILDASQTKSIIASRDIFDIGGTKLWARDQPVSSAVQRKLLDRQLRNPLESGLLVEDGVTPQALVQCAEALVDRKSVV